MPSEDFANKIFADNKGEKLLKPIYANGYYYVVLVNDVRMPEKYTDINQDVSLVLEKCLELDIDAKTEDDMLVITENTMSNILLRND